MFDRGDLFCEEVLKVGSFVAFCLPFSDMGGDAEVLDEFPLVLLEVGVVLLNDLWILVLDFGSKQVIVVHPNRG